MLLVDPREGSKELVQPLQGRGLDVVETKLEFGDVAFTGRGEQGVPVSIGVEVKKLPELLQSMRSGRLEGHQLLGMRQDPPLYDFAYLLIEGSLIVKNGQIQQRVFKHGVAKFVPMKGALSPGEFIKRLHVLQLRGGLTPIWSPDPDTTVLHLEMLYRVWTDKDLDKHESHLAIYNPPPLIPVSDERRVLSTLPGIGFKLSGAVAGKFRTLYKAMTASEQEWASIPGLGPKSAATIVRFIRGKTG